ncbi:MAG: LCP family protein, partial [Lachnospiraceae bacterium]|nr:LCP family protein [Lachnospiraceae bacterium]
YIKNQSVKKANAKAVVSFQAMNQEQLSSYQLTGDDKVKNVLLVGADKRGSETGYGRSDCMLIASVDTKNNQLKLTSLLGDMYVEIPGYGENRLSMAYSIGGISLLYETIASNFGIRLDHYAIIEFQNFVSIIDQVGGVDINVTEFEARYLQEHYTNVAGRVAIGENRLNGTQALAYVRIKQDAAGDFGRTVRQRKVMKSLYKQLTGTSISNLIPIMDKILSEIVTDIDGESMKSYLASVIALSSNDLMEYTVPSDKEYEAQVLDGTLIYRVDAQTIKESMMDFIYNPVQQENIPATTQEEAE